MEEANDSEGEGASSNSCCNERGVCGSRLQPLAREGDSRLLITISRNCEMRMLRAEFLQDRW
jgi:hypothetical protein